MLLAAALRGPSDAIIRQRFPLRPFGAERRALFAEEQLRPLAFALDAVIRILVAAVLARFGQRIDTWWHRVVLGVLDND